MKIRNALNGGFAEVDDEFGAQLIESGQWVADGDDVVKPTRKPRTRKAAVEEPKPEE